MAGRPMSAGMASARGVMSAGGGIRFAMTMEPSGKELSLAFSKWSRLIDDFAPIFADVEKIFYKHEAKSFASVGKSTGKPWAPLSEDYRAWKRKHFPGRPVLQRRGALLAALTRRGARGSLRKITKKGMEIGLDAQTEIGKYGEAHTFGTKTMPARPPIRFDPKAHSPNIKRAGSGLGKVVPLGTAIAQLFQVYIVRARKRAHADVFVDDMDWRRMRRGVLRLRTR